MSESKSNQHEWRCYVRDMIEFSRKILSYTDGLDSTSFVADSMIYDATLRNLELIGEAATHIPAEIRSASHTISWRDIIGLRNRLAHGYLTVDDDIIWDVVSNEVPKLLPNLTKLLESANQD